MNTMMHVISGRMLLIVLSTILIGLIPLSLMTGAVSLSWTQLWGAFTNQHQGASLIVWDVRLPRTLLAILIGSGLGLSGAVLQGLMRNPLADSSLFGAPQMAALGAVIVLSAGWAGIYAPMLPLAAIMGACLSVGLVLVLVGTQSDTHIMLLAGLAIGALAGALTSLVLSLSPNPFAVTEIVFWLLGSFEDRSMSHVTLAAPFIILGMILLLMMGSGLKTLTLGEDTARTLGINVTRLRWHGVIGVALIVGAGVAVSGTIGFIGLIVPHLVRALIGSDPQKGLIHAMLMGAVLLLIADISVRLIPARAEIKIGVLTALVGVPFFLVLVIRQRMRFAQ